MLKPPLVREGEGTEPGLGVFQDSCVMCFLCSQAFGVNWKGSLEFSYRGVRFQIVLGVSHLGLACSAGRLSQPSDIMLFFVLPLVWLGAAKECQSDEQSAAIFEALRADEELC